MKPGRELDVLVSKKVMARIYESDFRPEEYLTELLCPHYSTDIAAAWQVLEKICEIHKSRAENNSTGSDKQTYYPFTPTLVQNEEGLWGLDFVYQDYDYYPSPEFYSTAPHAICLAALKLMGVK